MTEAEYVVFDHKRDALYDPLELLTVVNPETGETLDVTIAKSYAVSGGEHAKNLQLILARNEHDTRLMYAARVYLSKKRVVGFMGGHSLKRDSEGYLSCARIARAFTRLGFVVLTGGGPGAMEAAALGAYFAGMEDSKLDGAIRILSKASSHLDKDWLARALDVVLEFPRSKDDCEKYPSLGIATWLYASEPTNIFSTKVAKIFQNSVREDFLANHTSHGVVFLQGSFGTFQEMFMVAAAVHYNFSQAPMAFFGTQFWTESVGLYPLLQQLSSKYGWSKRVSIHDDEQGLVKAVAAASHAQSITEKSNL